MFLPDVALNSIKNTADCVLAETVPGIQKGQDQGILVLLRSLG
jgi:hypothetical protein